MLAGAQGVKMMLQDKRTHLRTVWEEWTDELQYDSFLGVQAFIIIYIYRFIPVVPHKAVAEVSKIGSL